MASLASACPTFSSSFTSSSPLPHAKPSQLLVNTRRNQRFKVKASNESNGTSKSAETSLGKLDRRNVLLGVGMGGLMGAADMVGQRPALADLPLPFPSVCQRGFLDEAGTRPLPLPDGDMGCPLPAYQQADVKRYVIPENQVQRIRPAAHLLDADYIRKYMDAIQAMRDLPDDDPWSFKQQAYIHTAYCNYGHILATDPDGKFVFDRVHGSWFFAPFHRWYLYFYEKILGKLINDESFGLPYWNWDTPCGMTMPFMFAPQLSSAVIPNYPKETNPLWADKRNFAATTPPAVMDLSRGPAGTPDIQLVCNNLSFTYRQMVTNAQDATSFHGSRYVFGSLEEQPSVQGSLETLHVPAHGWVGGLRSGEGTPNGEYMGNFYSAGLDPIFYCHHANVDRLWGVWQRLGGQDFQDDLWKKSQFFFYDENRNPVYVTVEDCLNEERLGYTNQKTELPWLKAGPTARLTKSNVAKNSTAPSVAKAFPAKLDKVVKVLVQRPKINRTKEQKKKKKEILVIEGIEYPKDTPVKFDVFINDEDDKGFVLSKAEYAGTFVTVAHGGPEHKHGDSNQATSSMSIGLGNILEELKADDDEFILVTLIPKLEGDKVTIEGIKIDFK